MSTEPIISLDRVSFAYDGVPVLEDVSLAVGERDFVSLVGPNGGGKTTLLKLILGLLRPTRGTVRVFGKPPEDVRRRIGYMPQHARLDPLFPIRVLDVVLMGRLVPRHLGPYRAADREIALAALRQVELEPLALRPFSALSGGQQQRALIARALACQPDLLLMDEPTANLDISVESELYALLRGLSERLTVVLVSHDLGFVSQLVRTVVCVNRQVVVHPTSEITGEMIQNMYGSDVRMVRHDHRCAEDGHRWPNSSKR